MQATRFFAGFRIVTPSHQRTTNKTNKRHNEKETFIGRTFVVTDHSLLTLARYYKTLCRSYSRSFKLWYESRSCVRTLRCCCPLLWETETYTTCSETRPWMSANGCYGRERVVVADVRSTVDPVRECAVRKAVEQVVRENHLVRYHGRCPTWCIVRVKQPVAGIPWWECDP